MQAPKTISFPAPRKWYSQGKYHEINGHSIFVVDSLESSVLEGENDTKPVLVLIHGFPTSSFDWLAMWQDLSKRFRVIALDMLGFGYSDKPDERTYTIHGQADLFEAILVEKNVKHYHVLAHDYGVSVAQEMLARDINSVKPHILSCGLLNGGLFPETHRALLIQKLLLSPIGKFVNAFNSFNSFSRSFSHVFGEDTKPTQEELEIFWEIINFKDGKHLFHNCITYMRDRIEHRDRWLNALQTTATPIALINGSVDPVSGSHLVDRYKELNCRLDYLKQHHLLGHYPQVEAPDLITESYLEFHDMLLQTNATRV